MPDFANILKAAVEQQDWQLICGLYTNITGKPLSAPSDIEEHEEAEKEEDVLTKEYSLEELKYQNQLAPQEQDLELVDKNIDKMISSRYNDFTAPPRNLDNSNSDNRRMRSEPVGASKLNNVVGISEEPFIDNLTDSLVDPETGESLIGQNKSAKITPRNRRKELGMTDTTMVDVVCSSCHKELQISSSLSYGYSQNAKDNTWTCNNCNTRKGRRERSREVQ